MEGWQMEGYESFGTLLERKMGGGKETDRERKQY